MRKKITKIKKIAKKIIPKNIYNFLYYLKILFFKKRLTLIGNFETYSEALQKSNGYDELEILTKVKNAIIRIIEEENIWERDGFIFPNPQPKLEIVKIIKNLPKKNLSIVDFGGGLGTLYLNNRELFKSTNKYYIVEQKKFVVSGESISGKYNLPIKFKESLEKIEFIPDLIIFSSVLQYIPNLNEVLIQANKLAPEKIIIDRTCYTKKSKMKWHIQLNECYYEKTVSYPIRPLNRDYILNLLNNYKVQKKWINDFDADIPIHEGLLLEKLSKK